MYIHVPCLKVSIQNNKLLEMVSKGDNSSNLEIIEMICCLLKWASNTTFYNFFQLNCSAQRCSCAGTRKT